MKKLLTIKKAEYNKQYYLQNKKKLNEKRLKNYYKNKEKQAQEEKVKEQNPQE